MFSFWKKKFTSNKDATTPTNTKDGVTLTVKKSAKKPTLINDANPIVYHPSKPLCTISTSSVRVGGAVMEQYPKDIIDKMATLIHAQLKASGFSRRGKRTWLRPVKGMIQSVYLVGGRWNTRYRAEFTLDVGILVPEAYELNHDDKAPLYPKEYHCQLCITAAAINPGGTIKDSIHTNFAWKFEKETDLSFIEADVQEAVTERVLPYLNTISSAHDIVNSPGLREYNNSHIAIAYVTGNQELASQLMTEKYLRTAAQYKDLVREQSIRMGIPFSGIFSIEEVGLIRSLVVKARPELLDAVDMLGKRPLTDEACESLRGMLLDQFLANLDSESEPNMYAKKMDDLIGRLGMH